MKMYYGTCVSVNIVAKTLAMNITICYVVPSLAMKEHNYLDPKFWKNPSVL